MSQTWLGFGAGLKPSGEDHDYWRFIRGRDVDITLAHSALSTLENDDIFLVDEGASGNLTSTKYITASNMKTYFQKISHRLLLGCLSNSSVTCQPQYLSKVSMRCS